MSLQISLSVKPLTQIPQQTGRSFPSCALLGLDLDDGDDVKGPGKQTVRRVPVVNGGNCQSPKPPFIQFIKLEIWLDDFRYLFHYLVAHLQEIIYPTA